MFACCGYNVGSDNDGVSVIDYFINCAGNRRQARIALECSFNHGQVILLIVLAIEGKHDFVFALECHGQALVVISGRWCVVPSVSRGGAICGRGWKVLRCICNCLDRPTAKYGGVLKPRRGYNSSRGIGVYHDPVASCLRNDDIIPSVSSSA